MIEAEEGFRTVRLCDLTGISYRQADYWARTGLLVPSIKEAAGTGATNERLYSFYDLVKAGVIQRMRDADCGFELIRYVLSQMEEDQDARVVLWASRRVEITIYVKAIENELREKIKTTESTLLQSSVGT